MQKPSDITKTRIAYVHTCIHTYRHTLHYITLHCIALHCIALHYITYRQTYIDTYIPPPQATGGGGPPQATGGRGDPHRPQGGGGGPEEPDDTVHPYPLGGGRGVTNAAPYIYIYIYIYIWYLPGNLPF